MSLGTKARQTLRRAAEWERERIGLARAMPTPVRRGLKRLMRKSLLPDGRRFVPHADLESFFAQLGERGTRYVVIRWFEALPHDPDGDIDFLVGDDALDDFEQLMQPRPPGVPCDLYAETGAAGYSYGGIPYYPPALAARILERRVTHAGSVSVPCPEDHFFSLAYHCLYHKGPDCGLKSAYPAIRPHRAPKHDYYGTLRGLARQLGFDVDLTMEGLDCFLAERGWRPPPALLKSLAADNLWMQYHLAVELGAGGTQAGVLVGR